VFNETPASGDGLHILTVTGDAADTVTFTEAQWTLAGTVSDGSATYDRYVNGNAEVRVEQGIGVTFPGLFDLTTLAASQGFIIQGDAGGDNTGFGVSLAGDVNGDGFDDLIVGAPGGDDGGAGTGEAYVVFGTASGFGTADGTGRQVIDLTSLSGTEGFVIQGDAAGDQTGWSVSSAGDVNGDGFDDLIVGARFGDDGGSNAGEAYVVFGTASGFGTADGSGRQVIDLTSLSGTEGFVIQGDAAGDQAGRSVSSAGDVNGDGFDDLIVGASLGGTGAGEAYVVFGAASGFGTADGTGRQVIDLTSLSASQGVVIQGDAASDEAGYSVSSAGDVNGDGFDDLIVGAPFGDDGGSAAGEAYVVFGTASGFGTTDGSGRQVIDLTSLSGTEGFVLQGDASNDRAGSSVSFAGDVNGDGFDDLIVGAPFGADGGSAAGEAYVVFGTASGFGTADGTGRQVIDLTSLSADQGFIIQGDAAGDNAGWSVSSAGDINGDGFDDLIVGAQGGNDGGSNAGEAYVVFGTASGFGTTDGTGRQVIDLTSLSGTEGFVIQGDQAGDFAGHRVSAAGDIMNGDGFDDLIVGAPYGDDGGSAAGEAYIVYGAAFGGSSTPVTTTGTSAAEMLIGDIGDDDLIGGGGADAIRSGAGDDTLGVSDLDFLAIDGGTGTDTLRLDGSGLSLDLTDRELAARIDGIETIDLAGNGNTLTLDQLAVFNETPASGDGLHVLTVTGDAADTVTFTEAQWTLAGTVTDGATYDRYVNGDAEVRVEQGIGVTFPGLFDLTTLAASQGFIIQGDKAADLAGWSVSSAGDVNGDGIDDLIISARDGDDGGVDAGEAYVVFGTASGFGTPDGSGRQVIDLTSLAGTEGFIIRGDAAGDGAGYSVSAAGDVNGDGFDDLIVGAPGGDDGGNAAGEAYVVFGTASGFGATDGSGRQVILLSSLAASQGFIIQGDAVGDNAGFSVSAAGDVNGDGFDDLIVGASSGDDGGNYAGEAYVVFGTASGFGTADGSGRQVIDLTSLSAAQGFIIQGDVAIDVAGWSVSSAGDVNGDGLDDLIVGAFGGDDGGSNAGEAYVVFGTASGFGATDGTGRQVIDLTSLSADQGFIIQGDAGGDNAGYSVSAAGDVNGDGFEDLIVGAPLGGTAGETYVVFGTASGFGTTDGTARQVIDLTSLTATEGFIIQGDAGNDRAGVSVSSAGDVNGDGFDDLIVGAPRGDDGGSDSGEAYVVFGTASGFGTTDGSGRQVVDLAGLSTSQGFIIQGDAAGDQAGWSVSAAGDVNGDGFDDLIVGARYGDDGGNSAGEAYIVYGGAFGGSSAPITTTGTSAAEMLIGGLGDDDLTGAGGADAIRSGAGDDSIGVSDASFARIDGGTGTDTLRLDGTFDLDFSTLDTNALANIEAVDITGFGNNTLTLGFNDVINLSGTPNGDFTAANSHNSLVITGDAGDQVNLQADADVTGTWTNTGTTVIDGNTYDVLDYLSSGQVLASVAVDDDLTLFTS